MTEESIFSSGSVTEGHPDKLCDQISDAIVDRYLVQDRGARIVAEAVVATGVVFIATHFHGRAEIDAPAVAREVIEEAGYAEGEFNARDATVMTSVSEVPGDLRLETDEREAADSEIDAIVAGHQLSVFGFACSQTPELMPLPIMLAHDLSRQMAQARRDGTLPFLLPDGQAHVAVAYRDRRPDRIHSITLLAGLDAQAPEDGELLEALRTQVLEPAFDGREMRPDDDTRILVNPAGPLLVGGPVVHAGLTGRKNAVDAYGQYARGSEAALSGKDPSRIDRVGAYAARWVAKNVVAAGLALECEVQLTYAIGLAAPISVQVHSYGTGTVDDATLVARVREVFDLRPGAILRDLALRDLPATHGGRFFRRLGAYGHMGRTDLELPWEATGRAAALR